jgi:16S rRNA (adenine1518-N6/adenine1519-N6)-dimethyltransferase
MNEVRPNKQLGQHWLHDRTSLEGICEAAELTPRDTVLEIGPGLGTLTAKLVKQAESVVAVEFDRLLAEALPRRVKAANLEVMQQDILSFDLAKLPRDYKVVANVPYYITSKIIQFLMTAHNPPRVAVLLVQKEVAQRLAAKPGDMSILGISAQLYAEVTLGIEVPAYLFTPPPKVDSQVVILKLRETPLFPGIATELFFMVVKAGFSAKRKKLRSSLAGGLSIEKDVAEILLKQAHIDPHQRAEELSLNQWAALADIYSKRV